MTIDQIIIALDKLNKNNDIISDKNIINISIKDDNYLDIKYVNNMKKFNTSSTIIDLNNIVINSEGKIKYSYIKTEGFNKEKNNEKDNYKSRI